MKYGVLTATALYADMPYLNLGDQMQSEAIWYIYQKMGIPKHDIVTVELKDLIGGHVPLVAEQEYVILPLNVNLELSGIATIFPLPAHIIPVFLGLSFYSASRLPQELIDYFRYYAPIGCRDESTLQLMRQYHIPAYLFGCVTALLPRSYKAPRENGTVFFVDVPESFEAYFKKCGKTFRHIEHITHIRPGGGVDEEQYLRNETKALMQKYSSEAELVVTARLHCMSPCMAMGVPLVPVTDNISTRMAWIDRYIHIYTPKTYSEIDWHGQVVDYEDKKLQMLTIATTRIRDTVRQYGEILDYSCYLESRDRADYGNFYKERILEIPQERQENLKYIIWGCAQVGIHTYHAMQEVYPESKLIGVVDSYCEGMFCDGVPIQKPDILKDTEDAYILIATHSGEAYVRNYLTSLGKEEYRDFLSLSTITG